MLVRLVKLFGAMLMIAYAPLCSAETRECVMTGQLLAACAVSWEAIRANDDKLTEPGRSYEAGLFDGYIFGIAVADLQTRWCPQQPFTPNQLSAVTSRYLREHPEQWGLRPVELVRLSLAGAFPCGRKRP